VRPLRLATHACQSQESPIHFAELCTDQGASVGSYAAWQRLSLPTVGVQPLLQTVTSCVDTAGKYLASQQQSLPFASDSYVNYKGGGC